MPIKLVLAVVGLGMLMPSMLFALDSQVDDSLIVMLKGGKAAKPAVVKDAEDRPASGLSVKTKAVLGFALNYFVGFGVGSFVQGDTGSGVAIVVLEGLGLGAFITGYVLSGANLYKMYSSQSATQAASLTTFLPGIICMGAGYAVYFVGNLVGLIAPWTYAKRAHLVQEGESSSAIAAGPEVSPFVSLASTGGQIGPAIGLSISL